MIEELKSSLTFDPLLIHFVKGNFFLCCCFYSQDSYCLMEYIISHIHIILSSISLLDMETEKKYFRIKSKFINFFELA